MNITWVTRSFLDYRVPVYEALDKLCGHNLTLIYNEDVVPVHLTIKMKEILGDRCIPLKGEIRLVGKKSQPVSSSKSKSIRIPIQKGLIRKIKESKPDILISDGFFQWTYGPLLMKMFNSKLKHIMCYEGWAHTERNMQRFRIWYRKAVMRYIDAICCNGSLCADYVRSLGYNPDNVYIGNMAADTSFFLKESARISANERDAFRKENNFKGTVYVFSGRLVQLKGVYELICAWNKFQKGKDVTLVLIGDGPLKEQLEKYCVSNGLENVRIMGKMEYSNLPIYYKSADCFVIPTLQDNWSLVVPEAMACGLPVISSIYNGCWPELVTSKNGWTFDPLDERSFVDTLENCYIKREKFVEMGKSSLEIVLKHNPEKIANTIFEVCEKF